MAAPTTLVPPVTRPSDLELEEYPYSDGKILMETDPHANSIVAVRNQLQWHFEGVPDVYVAGSMAVYYREGDRSAVVAPDVFVVLGVAKRARKSYLVWEEGGVVPTFVLEVASLSTSGRDATAKRETYERMGVREYWRFDPVGKHIRKGLEGWRLAATGYERMRETGPAGWYRSEVLGLDLRAEEWLLRFRDTRLGRELMTHAETSRALQESDQQRDRAECERAKAVRERDEAVRERDEANRRLCELEAKLRSSADRG